jgi:hypothetical protein
MWRGARSARFLPRRGRARSRHRQALAERLGLRAGDPFVPRRSGAKIAAGDCRCPCRCFGGAPLVRTRSGLCPHRHLQGRPGVRIAGRPCRRSSAGWSNCCDRANSQRGKGADRGLVTTAGAIASEQRIVAAVEAGRGMAPPIVDPAEAGARLQALSQLKYGMTLNQGQEAAGRLLLGSTTGLWPSRGWPVQARAPCSNPLPTFLREEGKPYSGSPSRTRWSRCLSATPGSLR